MTPAILRGGLTTALPPLLLVLACACADDVISPPGAPPGAGEEAPNGPIRLIAAPPGSSLRLRSGNQQTGVANDTLPTTVSVLVRDAAGNPVSGVLVTWRVVDGGGATRATRTGTGLGGASVNSWILGAPGAQALVAEVSGAGSVTFSATAVEAATLVLTRPRGDGLTGISGDTLGAAQQVRVADQTGRPVSVKLEWLARSGGSVVSVRTATNLQGVSDNRWVLGSEPGTQHLVARVAGGDSAVFSATAVSAGTVQFAITAGDRQSGVAGDSLRFPLRVRATSGGRPVSALVRWAVKSGGGALRSAVVPTDVGGYAANRWLLGHDEGPQTAQATLNDALLTFTTHVGPRPNVLLIMADDLGDWVGYLGGHPNASTPNLDRLVRMGVAFDRAYAAAPVCNPSRAALLTGVRPSTSGIYGNGGTQTIRRHLPKAVTLPELFRRHGYLTVGIGKVFHQATAYSADSGRWERYVRPGWPDPVPQEPRGSHVLRWGPLDVADDTMSDHRGVTVAADFLAQPQDRPFFLAVGLFRPHHSWYVPRRWFDLHPLAGIRLPEVLANDLDDVPPAGVALADPAGVWGHAAVGAGRSWAEGVRAHLASISFMDAQLGRLLDALEASPHRGNTIVVFLGDHGVHLGEKSHWQKSTLWEESTHAPLVFVVPGLTPAGGRSPRTVDFMALYPTLAELADIPLDVPQTIEGRSIRALLANPGAAWEQPAVSTFRPGNHAVRSERWRYIRYADGGEELYDHSTDPDEWHNLAGDPALEGVKASLRGWMPVGGQ
jgi:arylsulfatase A-like enzyme